MEVQWGRGPWNVYGEWQRFQRIYRAIPNYWQRSGYAEARRVLHPRWYVATRIGYIRTSRPPDRETYEVVVGFRPDRHQLVKAGSQIQQGPAIRGTLGSTVAVQVVCAFRPISIARD